MDAAVNDGAIAIHAIAFLLLMVQLPAAALLLARLLQGPTRRPPLRPGAAPEAREATGAPTHPAATDPPRSPQVSVPRVSVVVPTLNEVHRLQPCLDGLCQQGPILGEILVVDSRSTDGTPELVQAAQAQEPRLRLITDDPLPPGWIGRPWALHQGFLQSSPESHWVLGIDADTVPHPQLVECLVTEAERSGYDLVSLAPRFILKFPGEWWLQPALLLTLIYRFGPAGGGAAADRGSDAADLGSGVEGSSQGDRVMANGQCFLTRRSLLVALDGYRGARSSFCDDVTLARQAAAAGAKVAFWDGSQLLKVRMYEGFAETWREWGRSLDLKDAAPAAQVWGDWLLLLLVQALPLPLVLLSAIALGQGVESGTIWALLGLNGALLLARLGMLLAIAASYDFSQSERLGPFPAHGLFWLSPLADGLAVLRILRSSLRRPTQWRGRMYP